jgi:hypothetical protein
LNALQTPVTVLVVCSTVLRFARDEAQSLAMLEGSRRPLRPGGLFFCRVASTIGMPERHQPLGGMRFQLPGGSRRFLVDEEIPLRLGDECMASDRDGESVEIAAAGAWRSTSATIASICAELRVHLEREVEIFKPGDAG